jgi:hypothetical protein
MKRLTLPALLLVMMTSGCEKREFYFTSSYSESGSFTVNQAGAFSESATYTLDETLNALNLPSDVLIDSIYINSISIKGQTLAGNQATGLNVQGTLTYGGQSMNLFNTNTVAITGSGIAELGLNDLNPSAINLLKKFMTASILNFLGLPFGSFPLQNSFTVAVTGTPAAPSQSSVVNLTLDFNIAFDLSYYTCVDALPFMGNPCY